LFDRPIAGHDEHSGQEILSDLKISAPGDCVKHVQAKVFSNAGQFGTPPAMAARHQNLTQKDQS
jgi:hypothetical protein